jgi:hypothetical protein
MGASIKLSSLMALGLAVAGCSAGGSGTLPDGGVAPTWHKDVQPLVQQHCQNCHNADGIAPFALESYADAKAHISGIARAVGSRQMPPWLPAEGCQDFKGSRRLDDATVQTFVDWKEGGGLEGNASDSPGGAPPVLASLPRVDKTLTQATAYTPNSGVSDDYRCFVLDPGLTQDTDVVGMDIVPGSRKMVHHVILYAMPAADAQTEDNKDPAQGYTCYGGPGGSNPTMVGGWVPGTSATVYPTDTGVPVLAGQVFVMQIHYNMDNGHETDHTQVKLMYAQGRVAKPAKILPWVESSFQIPPNATGYSTTATAPAWLLNAIPEKTIWGVIPHMHVKGRNIKVTMDNTCLVDIPQWDFHWQQPFFYKAPVTMPTGATITLTCTWDNNTNKLVTWGEGTDDEMCLNYFYLTQ